MKDSQFTIAVDAVTKLLALAALLAAGAASAAPALTERARLAAIYDSILRARFDEAEARLATACPPAPTEVCMVLKSAVLWWQIQIDADDPARDGEIQTASTAAIAAAERWTKREPQRAESWFYLASAYGPITQWRIMRGQRLAAARDALKIRNALERAIALDPSLHDAYFGIGLYHYYADVAPAALKFLRFLLLMPGGNRSQGLREMELARTQGVLLAGEADYQMHYVYLWYEKDTARALTLLRGLDDRYPTNPVFLQRIAEVEQIYRHDLNASRLTWEQALRRAADGQVARPVASEMQARLGLSSVLIESGDAARALDVLQPVVATPRVTPYGVTALAHFAAARAYERLGDRTRALTSLDHAIAYAPLEDPQSIKSRARAMRSRLRSSAR